jgi:TonB family protein
VAVCLIASAKLSAQTPLCVPNLDYLTYPAAALSTRIQGTVNLSFTVSADGKVADMDSIAYPSLRVGVEEVLRSATMTQACVGQRVSIRVNFLLSSADAPNSAASVERVSEMVWQVVVPAPTIEVTIYDPAWAFTRKGRFLHRVRGWFSNL